MASLSRLALGAALLAATLAAATIATGATATLAVPTKLAVPAHLAAPAKLPRDASSASKGIGPPPGGCRAMARSTDVFNFCLRGGGPSSLCCRALLEAAGSGGLTCVCEIANTPFMATSGNTAADLLAAYTTCGGEIQVDARLATKCGAESFLLDNSGPPHPDSVQTDPSARNDDSEEDDSGEENVISPPPPRRSHHHHRKGHQTQEVDMEAEDAVMPEVHVPHHQESLLDKLERCAQVVGAILPPVTVLVLVIYILCAGPGHRVDRAKSMFKALVPILPVLVEQWMATKNKTASTTTTAAVAPNPSVSVERDAGIAMGIVSNPDLDLVPVTRPKSP